MRGGRPTRGLVRACAATQGTLELTEENVETILEEIRPYLIADGGECEVRSHLAYSGERESVCVRNTSIAVQVADIDGLTVYLRLKGACGSCPSSAMTLKMGIERRWARARSSRLPFRCKE